MKIANFRNVAYLAVMFVTPIILALGFATDRQILRVHAPAANALTAERAPGR
ncbi:MAG TPA: hypothetical protein PKA55_17250 [Rhodoblastus sp.]|nr:hypothetical protein [Rhodoblastus sp.]